MLADNQEQYPDGIVWDFNSTDAISAANSAVATAACGSITADTSFVNSYGVSATFTTNSTRRMQIKLPNNVIQQKNSDGDYIYNYLHILVGNPQDTDVTFGCGINTTSENTQVTLPANSWTVASFYIEDLFLAGNSNYKRDGKNYAESVQGVAFQMSDQVAGANTTNAGIKYNLDKIWVTTGPLPSFDLKSVTPSNNYDKMSSVNTRFVFKFSRELKNVSAEVLPESLICEDGTSTDTTLSVHGNKAIITSNEILKPDTSYTFDSGDAVIKDIYGVKYSHNLTYSFKTDSSSLLISDIIAKNSTDSEIYSVPSSGDVNLSAYGVNYSDSAANAIIVANVTDEESGISQLVCGQNTVLSLTVSSAESISPLSLSLDANTYVTATVVDNLENCRPISNSYFILKSDEASSGVVYTGEDESGSVSVSLNEPVLSLDTLTVSGEISGNANGLVNIVVREKSSNELKLVMPVKATNGSFTHDYIFDGSGSGKYEISVVPGGEADAVKCEVTYLGASTKEAIRAAFDNNSVTPQSAQSLLQTYRDGMGIPSNYTDELLLHIASTLCEQKPYATYPDLVEMINLSVNALNDLNNASWSSYKTVFSTHPLILNNDTMLASYNAYKDGDKAEIHKIAVNSAPFADFISLRQAIADATDRYARKLQQQQRPSNSGGGSSGSSFGGGSVSIGGGSSSSELKDKADSPVVDTPSGKVEFSDVSESHWAYSAINELASRNIISGYEDGSFAGGRSVSRAEFIKMLTGCFTYSEAKGEKFTDVPTDAWYSSYLARASSAGIVKGNNGLFMPDASITRQDAALMIYRSLVYKNVSLIGKKEFSDSANIADYAADAVSLLGNTGIISGYEDGSFGPESNITRFETAQLIYKVIKYLSGGAVE